MVKYVFKKSTMTYILEWREYEANHMQIDGESVLNQESDL